MFQLNWSFDLTHIALGGWRSDRWLPFESYDKYLDAKKETAEIVTEQMKHEIIIRNFADRTRELCCSGT